IRIGGVHPEPLVAAIVFGLAVVGGAFMLAWAAEVAQLDISAGLAIALLALIAVLPEYAVDFVFTWKAGDYFGENGTCQLPGDEINHCNTALANMTGGNQLLIGIGWSLVVLIAAYRLRQARKGKVERIPPGTDLTQTEVHLERSHSVEISFLVVATLYG